MEILGEAAHRMLKYVEAVTRQGYSLTTGEFRAYAEGWDQQVTYSGADPGSLASTLESIQSLAASFYGSRPRSVEPMLDYLCRLGWLSKSKGSVLITQLGRAVLREANSPRPDSEAESTLEVIIDPNNPFAYAQLMTKIASFEQCMVVDPYLDQDQLLTLAMFQSVTKILTSNYDSKKKTPAFGVVLASAPHLQVRMVERKLLHDRIVMPSEGKALMLGSSLNSITSRFGVATPLEEASSRLIRGHYDELWQGGQPVEPARLEPVALNTAATVEDGTGS